MPFASPQETANIFCVPAMYELTALGLEERLSSPTQAIAHFMKTPDSHLPVLLSLSTNPPSIVASTTLQWDGSRLRRQKKVFDADPALVEAHEAYRQ